MNKELEARLIEAAIDAADKTYSPYSNFPVGSAVLTASGIIFPGTNIENASYGLTMCGDRNAIFNAVSNGHKDIEAMAIACPDAPLDNPRYLMPCGACRQVMVEFMDEEAPVLIKDVGRFTVGQLLPMAFKLR